MWTGFSPSDTACSRPESDRNKEFFFPQPNLITNAVSTRGRTKFQVRLASLLLCVSGYGYGYGYGVGLFYIQGFVLQSMTAIPQFYCLK
jgi:hypothetical protein